jgi:hypothetical protein
MENIDDNFYKMIQSEKINCPTDNNSGSGFTGMLGITGPTGNTGNTGQQGQTLNSSCIGTTGPTGPIHSNNDKCNHIHFLYQ